MYSQESRAIRFAAKQLIPAADLQMNRTVVGEHLISWQGAPQTDSSAGLVELQQLLKLQEFGLLGFQSGTLGNGWWLLFVSSFSTFEAI